jgi:hypothetical protein
MKRAVSVAIVAGWAGFVNFVSSWLFNRTPCYGNYDYERIRHARYSASTTSNEWEHDYHYYAL